MVTYKILQIKDIENTVYAFRPFKLDIFNIEDYEVRYTGEAKEEYSDAELCDAIFDIFNTQRPEGFTGHSLSMSDLVWLERDGRIRVYYCDLVGWQTIKEVRS